MHMASDSLEFVGKAVVVTGGTGALGTAVVTALLNAGAACYVPNFIASELEGWVSRGRAGLHVVEGIDLAKESHVRSFYEQVPPLWASIHLAGGFRMSNLEATSADEFAELWKLNALTCFLCCKEAVASIRRRTASDGGGVTGGRIVNVAARPALEPRTGSGMAAYTSSKAAVAALTVALGEELAREQIWVNAVAPSILNTEVNRRAMPNAEHASWPAVDAVARAIVQLASPANGCTRGAVLPLYGAV
ncbi:SDR family NAD(P)-dependent oxidoreductase [soil metagenome]